VARTQPPYSNRRHARRATGAKLNPSGDSRAGATVVGLYATVVALQRETRASLRAARKAQSPCHISESAMPSIAGIKLAMDRSPPTERCEENPAHASNDVLPGQRHCRTSAVKSRGIRFDSPLRPSRRAEGPRVLNAAEGASRARDIDLAAGCHKHWRETARFPTAEPPAEATAPLPRHCGRTAVPRDGARRKWVAEKAPAGGVESRPEGHSGLICTVHRKPQCVLGKSTNKLLTIGSLAVPLRSVTGLVETMRIWHGRQNEGQSGNRH